jgi:hypothetical protein
VAWRGSFVARLGDGVAGGRNGVARSLTADFPGECRYAPDLRRNDDHAMAPPCIEGGLHFRRDWRQADFFSLWTQADAVAIFRALFMPKVFLKTYGCQMNERDSEQVARMLVARGYEMTPEEREADVVLLNTCSVRDMAEQKALGKMGLLGRLRAA